MTGLRNIFSFIAAAMAPILLTGCFTGVESTPRITASDVRRTRPVVTPEDTFLAGIGGECPGKWRPGKLFYVADPKVSIIFGATAPRGENLAGKWIAYEGAGAVAGVTGNVETDLRFRSPAGAEMVYRVAMSPDSLAARRSLEVPFTVEKSVVDSVRNRLQGRRFYTMTRDWRNDSDKIVGGRKFVPVTVDSVTPGTAVYPVKVAFHDDSGRSARLFLAPGATGSSPRTFANLFAFSDPRTSHPAISDENWALIIDGKVAPDMTREECRLSLGAPVDVDRRAGYSFLQEVWVYENGIYLFFEDGLLRRYRR